MDARGPGDFRRTGSADAWTVLRESGRTTDRFVEASEVERILDVHELVPEQSDSLEIFLLGAR